MLLNEILMIAELFANDLSPPQKGLELYGVNR